MFLEKFGFLLPGIPAVALAACVGASLFTYEAPTYGNDNQTQTSDVSSADATTSSAAVAKGDFDLDDGVYRGTGVGFSGNTVVDVTIKDRTITAIDIISEEDTDAFFNRAKEGVIKEILEQQSYDVDAVSGATYSSRGIKNAVKNAITGEKDTSTRGDGGGTGSTESADVSDITEGTFEDGTYTGSGQGFSGTTTVRVTVKDHKITNIEILSHADADSYFNKAKTLISKIISGNTTNVDTVSGATYSSRGIINAVRNALGLSSTSSGSSGNSSGTNSGTGSASVSSVTESGNWKDGTYTGSASGNSGGFNGGTTRVSVTISGGKITAINVLSNQDTAQYFNRAKSTIINSIISKQTTNVDTVSGASFSSRGIINAVRNALSKAEGSNSDNADTEDNSGADTSKSADTNQNSGTNQKIEGTYTDGTYTASASCTGSGFDYTINVSVTVKDSKITAVTAMPSGIDSTSQSFFDQANASVPANIVSKQSTSVDAVSGATYSSKAIMSGAASALSQAKVTQAAATVDKSALNKAINSAEKLRGIDYTPSTWKAFKNALAAAKAVSRVSGASQSDVDGQVSALAGAVNNLEQRANTAALKNTISNVKAQIGRLNKEDYTEDSWNNLQTALKNAQAAYGDMETTQSVADNLVTRLNTALSALTEVGTTYKDGTYSATASCTDTDDGQFDYTITTTITVKDNRITNVTATPNGIDDTSRSFFERANAAVPGNIVSSQSTSVDAVSRATFSSNAIMKGAADALAKAKNTSETVTVDKTALGNAIDNAAGLSEDAYTPSTWTNLQDALSRAREVYEEENVSQDEVDVQTNALNKAVDGLTQRANKTELENTINEIKQQIESLNSSDYTEDSWNNLQTALSDAESAYSDAETTQSAADTAVNTLKSAIANLASASKPVYEYWGEVTCTDEDGNFDDYTIRTTIFVQDGRIIRCDASSEDIDDESKPYFDYAVNGRTRRGKTYTSVLQQIVDKQSASDDDIDSVSGATRSSDAIVKGAKLAIEELQKEQQN